MVAVLLQQNAQVNHALLLVLVPALVLLALAMMLVMVMVVVLFWGGAEAPPEGWREHLSMLVLALATSTGVIVLLLALAVPLGVAFLRHEDPGGFAPAR